MIATTERCNSYVASSVNKLFYKLQWISYFQRCNTSLFVVTCIGLCESFVFRLLAQTLAHEAEHLSDSCTKCADLGTRPY